MLDSGFPEMTQEFREGLTVKSCGVATEHQSAVSEADCSEVRYAFSRRVMKYDWVLILGGIHMRHRNPCCWKWTSSSAQRSTASSFRNLRSFFYAASAGPGLPWPEPGVACAD